MEEQGEYIVEAELSLAQTLILDKVRAHHKGYENRVRRKALLSFIRKDGGLRIGDRHMREEIAALRENGYPVLSTRDGGFYWPESPEDVNRFIQREIANRARHLHIQEAALRRNIHVHFGQMGLGE